MFKGSPFSLRDTIQYALPLGVAVVLFLPFAPGVGLEVALVAAVLLSYSVHGPLKAAINHVYGVLPGVRTQHRALEREMKWWNENWDADQLFYEKLTSQEREYLYMTTGYADYHRKVSFIVLVYAVVQVLIVSAAVFENGIRGGLFATTPMLGGWRANSLLLLAVAAVVFRSSFNSYVGEFGDVIRIYTHMSRKYHRAQGGLAVALWGTVLRDDRAAAGADVRIVFTPNDVVVQRKTDEKGRFSVPLGEGGGAGQAVVTAKLGAAEATRVVLLGDKDVPEVTLRLNAAAAAGT